MAGKGSELCGSKENRRDRLGLVSLVQERLQSRSMKEEVREKVTEGTSALFALTSGATAPDKVVDELKAYDFEIISTNLPEEQEKQLREAFAQE